MMLFFFYTGWRRMVMVSSDRPEYLAAATAIEDAVQAYTFAGFTLNHHYSGVGMNASADTIDAIYGTIIYEARGTCYGIVNIAPDETRCLI